MTSCSTCLEFCRVLQTLLMQGSHTVNHLGCDHFRWPGMLTVFGSVHFKKYLSEDPQSCAYVLHRTFFPKPFTKS